MKRLLLTLILTGSILSTYAKDCVKITWKDGSETNHNTKEGGENPDWYCVSDWSDSGLYYVEELDYQHLQEAVQKAGHTCEIDIHNWDYDKDGHLYC